MMMRMMRVLCLVVLTMMMMMDRSYSYNIQPTKTTTTSSRRSWLTTVLTTSAAAAVALVGQAATPLVAQAAAAPTTEEQNVYFGVGCFWHIQFCFVQAERDLLGRGDKQLTSLAGYAGGRAVGQEGQVCYHNLQSMADYGRLGHAEVVGMSLPQDKIVDFSKIYFSLFDPRTKDRVDPMDRGPEYRSLMGLPGGVNHASFPAIEAAAAEAGFTLKRAKGNDPDTLQKQVVYVHDTAQFPFYQAEVYHQYHNDFQSPKYGKAYNDLAQVGWEEGRIKTTGCPDRV